MNLVVPSVLLELPAGEESIGPVLDAIGDLGGARRHDVFGDAVVFVTDLLDLGLAVELGRQMAVGALLAGLLHVGLARKERVGLLGGRLAGCGSGLRSGLLDLHVARVRGRRVVRSRRSRAGGGRNGDETEGGQAVSGFCHG